MTKLCFIDTETTSLRPDRRAWEIAVILRAPGLEQQEFTWLVAVDDLDLGNADPTSLKIGRFYQRHHQIIDPARQAVPEAQAMREIEQITRGAHLVGAVPSFDAEVLGNRMRANGICPSWHYHLIDVEPLAAGWLHRHAVVLENRQSDIDEAGRLRRIASPPWKSDNLTAALGVKVSDEDRHTAIGDARWAMQVYDAVVA